MNGQYRKVLAALIGGMLIASACSSSGDGAAQIEAAQTVAAESTTAAPATTTAPEETAAETSPADDSAGDPISIEAEVVFGEVGGTGTWTVIEGADVLGCDGGTLTEFPAEDAAAQELTCTGTRSGAFVGRFAPAAAGGTTYTSSWDVIVASGDFGDMSGFGSWTGEIDAAGDGATIELTLDVKFGEVAVPVAELPRINKQAVDECGDGFVTVDGLVEFATHDGTMVSLDLVSGEITEHGEPPVDCVWWLSDPVLGRRVALSLPGDLPNDETKVWLGPNDGEWDVELDFDEVTLLLSRSLEANRLLFSQPESGSVIMLDATTGEQVGASLEGNFEDGRHSTAVAVSPDGRFVALGGANAGADGSVGQLFFLDAVSGEEIARVDTKAPTTALAFDTDGGALVAGLFTGDVITVDTDSFEVVAKTNIGTAATIGALGIRPDGLIVVATDANALVLDRVTGPTGAAIAVRQIGAAGIRPDGSVNSLTSIQRFEVYEIEG